MIQEANLTWATPFRRLLVYLVTFAHSWKLDTGCQSFAVLKAAMVSPVLYVLKEEMPQTQETLMDIPY